MQLKIKSKVVASFLLVGIIPFAIIGLLALNKSSTALETASFDMLKGVQAIKTTQIEKFFAERQGDMGVLVETMDTLKDESFNKLTAVQAIKRGQISQYFQRVQINLAILAKNPTTVKAIRDFDQAFVAEDSKTGGSSWNEVDQQVGHVFGNLLKKDGYYDIFLISADGDVVYSATRESDLGQNLTKGPLKNSGLAKAFRDSVKQKVGFADLAPYAPSANKPAGFLASSVVDASGKRVGAVVKLINDIAIQTNLLALNATIEAARAAVEEQGAATKEIARNVEEASVGTAEVSRNITGVNESSAETGRASGQVLEAARELSVQSEHLRDDVDKFIAYIRKA